MLLSSLSVILKAQQMKGAFFMKHNALSSKPKKVVLTLLGLAAALAVTGTVTIFAAEGIAKNNAIGVEAVKEKVLTDAGVDPADAVFTQNEFEFENGSFVYEVEFTAGGIEYDYLVKASDGTVLSRRAEVDDDFLPGGLSQKNPPLNEESVYIGLEAAKEKALADAGLADADVTFTKQKSDREDGRAVYDIEFYTAERYYEYEIDAASGAVYKKSIEERMIGRPGQGDSAHIGLEAAKEKALADAGLADADVTFTKQKSDREDGRVVYDIEFYTAAQYYEYEIDAATGAIQEKSVEFRPMFQQPEESGDSNIGLEKAKSIALEHAGFSAEEIFFSKAKFENDDGIMVYEIEFYKDRIEYEYTIHARKGTILEFDAEYDD